MVPIKCPPFSQCKQSLKSCKFTDSTKLRNQSLHCSYSRVVFSRLQENKQINMQNTSMLTVSSSSIQLTLMMLSPRMMCDRMASRDSHMRLPYILSGFLFHRFMTALKAAFWVLMRYWVALKLRGWAGGLALLGMQWGDSRTALGLTIFSTSISHESKNSPEPSERLYYCVSRMT